ncbi:MAG TPA: hypothetical protein ENG40_01405 [Thermoprotei archaeon]|nr:hypothetical protein [Thermoprotei archaeon]
MKIVGGIDGGATKTECIVMNVEGNILGKGLSGPSNYHVVGIDNTIKAVRESILNALKNIGEKKIDYLTIGLAGLDTRRDFEYINNAFKNFNLASKLDFKHDSVIALVGAHAGRPGIIIIAGTGSVAAGINRNRRYVRVGGWGYLLGDEGSAFTLGRRGLIAVLREYDGRGISTKITEKIFSKLGINDYEDIILKIYGAKEVVGRIASLAPCVTEAAAEGDSIANEIISSEMENVGELIYTVAKRLEMLGEEIPIAIIGGVFRAGEIVIEKLKRSLRRYGLKFRLIKPIFPPSIGATIWSLQSIGIEVDDRIIENIRNSLRLIK